MLIEDGQVYLRSTATLRIARRLDLPWRMAGALALGAPSASRRSLSRRRRDSASAGRTVERLRDPAARKFAGAG